MADMPFMSYATPEDTLYAGAELMRAGAQMIKLEGGTWLSESINKLVERGIPVCAHLGSNAPVGQRIWRLPRTRTHTQGGQNHSCRCR